MRLREVDVRFADGVDRRQVVTLGDALSEMLADLGTVELVALAVSGADLATFSFATTATGETVALPMPTVVRADDSPADHPPGASSGAAPVAAADPPAPDAEDCREAVRAAAADLALGRVEVVADRESSVGVAG